MGRKLSLVQPPEVAGKPTYVVANADESEPGAFKDREIMRRVPHRFIEGCLIAAHAIGSKHVFIYIRGEYLAEFEVLKAAADEVRDAGLLGDVVLVLHRGAGAYICGEESALLESLEGKRGQPRPRPPFPPVSGPLRVADADQQRPDADDGPDHHRPGGAWYAKIGPEASPGTVVYSISGNVERPGNYELPLGTTLRELIYDVGGGIPGGRKLKAVIPGGSSVPVFTPDEIDTPADFDSIQAAGSFLGSAAIIAVDDRACMVQLALRVEKFYMHESCGKCTPCREGTRWMVSLLEKIESGRAEHSDLELLRNVCDRVLGKSLCALGDFAVYPVASYIDKYREEFEAHIEQGGCPFGGESSIEGIVAPIDQHTHSPGARCPSMLHRQPFIPNSAQGQGCKPLEYAGNRHRHSRRARGSGAEGDRARRDRAGRGDRDPRLLLRAAARAGDRRLPDVPRRGRRDAEAPGRLHADREDGMVVRTAQTSAAAADGQSSTLEFILVNHPLDCPVCDKGGECPLQDLTFRWGPPVTRNTFPKRTFEKPIPISPTIALDRERCILCYRCTRFSSDVAEDSQLVARDRGSQSVIATFEDEPYRAPFSGQRDRALPGRRAHLDPVPLRSPPVGDPGRPDGLRPLPGRLQHRGDDARGQGQADRLAQPPRGRRGLALRQGPFRLHAPAGRRPHRRSRKRARACAATRRSPGTTRSTRRSRCCAPPEERRHGALRAPRPSSRPTRSASCCARASARTAPSCPRT